MPARDGGEDRHVGDGGDATRGFPVGPFGFAGHWFSTGQSEPVDAMDGSELVTGAGPRGAGLFTLLHYTSIFFLRRTEGLQRLVATISAVHKTHVTFAQRAGRRAVEIHTTWMEHNCRAENAAWKKEKEVGGSSVNRWFFFYYYFLFRS